MSWLFGYKSQVPQMTEQISGEPQSSSSGQSQTAGGKSGDQGLSSSEKKAMEAYRFDSSALERAADAAKTLEKSSKILFIFLWITQSICYVSCFFYFYFTEHSKDALELSKMQEQTRQTEYLAKVKEYEAHIEQAKVEQKRVDYEERGKLIKEETIQQQKRAQYQDQLSRKRYEDQLAQQQQVQADNLRKQEESVAKQEQMRRETIAHEIEMKEKNRIKLFEAEMRAKAKVDRENRDITLEQIRAKAEEHRVTVLEGIK